jgi:hypothetical protein
VRLLLGAGGAGSGGLDEMLDADEQLSEQLDSLPYLVRFQYEKSRCARLACAPVRLCASVPVCVFVVWCGVSVCVWGGACPHPPPKPQHTRWPPPRRAAPRRAAPRRTRAASSSLG